MGSLRINKVNYKGDKHYYESPYFKESIILVEGDNGTGKTTFCNLIYYCLGGKVREFSREEEEKRHKEITSDKDNFVELYISINGEGFQIIRFIEDNDITVTPYALRTNDASDKEPRADDSEFLVELDATQTKVLPVFRPQASVYTFSDWLLSKLGISVVEIYQGYASFRVNITDIFRLIYLDQQSDTEQIYKKIDIKTNHVSDSELLRKAIFELLTGKSFSDYYDAIIEAKTLEREKNVANGLLQEYMRLADELTRSSEPRNKTFLVAELRGKEDQLEKLQAARNSFKRNRSTESNLEPMIEEIKNDLIARQLSISEKKEDLISLFDEKYKLVSIKETTAREVSQINKIIHSHDQLNLFSADTCPYCLGKVERATGHCVCGSEIDEKQYERFFYTSLEYKEILKAKTKTLATIDLAIEDCAKNISDLKIFISLEEAELPTLHEQLHEKLSQIDERIDLETINDIDDKILNVREDSAKLHQLIEIESKLEGLQKDFDRKREGYQRAELKRKSLEIQTRLDIEQKVKDFSEIYNQLMTQTLAECRSARISLDHYLPILDGGEYKEASSRVSTRLMYYLTLMTMSLTSDDVPFPRFLLIDTPETAGIELDKLINCIGQISALDEFHKDYQVIITTGLKKYPESFIAYRKIYLPEKKHGLLKRWDGKSTTPSDS